MGKKEQAQELFQKAYDLYSLFWAVNMKIIKTDDIKKIDDEAMNKHDKVNAENKNMASSQSVAPKAEEKQVKSGFLGKMGELVRKAIDCCIE